MKTIKKMMLGLACSSSILLMSCGGPSACDCKDNALKGIEADYSLAKDCVENFGDGKKMLEAIKDCK